MQYCTIVHLRCGLCLNFLELLAEHLDLNFLVLFLPAQLVLHKSGALFNRYLSFFVGPRSASELVHLLLLLLLLPALVMLTTGLLLHVLRLLLADDHSLFEGFDAFPVL